MITTVRNRPVFVVHQKGNLVYIKTGIGRGMHPIAFASKADGQAYLRLKGPLLSIDTPAEILRLNPIAFNAGSEVLYLPTRDAITAFLAGPNNFRTEEFIVGIYVHDPPVLEE